MTERKRLHDRIVDSLVKEYDEQGFRVIREGGMPCTEGWHIPDIFLLNQHNQLMKVIDVVITDNYEYKSGEATTCFEKVQKIKEYYDSIHSIHEQKAC